MVVLLLGAPGSGKGTIANFLEKEYGFFHLATGQLFRQITKQNSPLAQKIKKIINAGKLVNDALTNKLVKNNLIKKMKKNVVLDGYPRNIEQAKYLNKFCKIDYVFDLCVKENIIIKRIIGRRICPVCQAIYNIYYKKPHEKNHCNFDHHILIKRDDDTKQTIKQRLQEYKKFNHPLVAFYQQKGNYKKITLTGKKLINQIKKFLKL